MSIWQFDTFPKHQSGHAHTFKYESTNLLTNSLMVWTHTPPWEFHADTHLLNTRGIYSILDLLTFVNGSGHGNDIKE